MRVKSRCRVRWGCTAALLMALSSSAACDEAEEQAQEPAHDVRSDAQWDAWTEAAPEIVRGTVLMTRENEGPREVTLHGLRRIEGSLRLEGLRGIRVLRFADLTHVGGIFIAYNPDLRRIELPALVESGRFESTRNPLLEVLSLPVLRASGSLWISFNQHLTSLRAPLLGKQQGSNPSVPGASRTVLRVRNNPSLTSLELPALQSLGDANISDNARLERVDLARVREVSHGLSVRGPRLSVLRLDALERVGSSLEDGLRLSLQQFDRLQLPSLETVEGEFLLFGGGVLAELSLPRLEEAWQIQVSDSDLRSFEAPRLRQAGLSFFGPRMQSIDLASLQGESCEGLVQWVPDCALEEVAPGCVGEIEVERQGCDCDPSGDLSLAECPSEPELGDPVD